MKEIIEMIRTSLNSTFYEVDKWFDEPENIRVHKLTNESWNINQILEHISLTNHYLLILIDKGYKKAIFNKSNLNLIDELKTSTFNLDKLNEIGLYQSFEWIRPEHMEPMGKDITFVREKLKSQLDACLSYLELMKNGEGILYKTTMSVNGLGKINVYEYIYFLVMHAKRHISQMDKNKSIHD